MTDVSIDYSERTSDEQVELLRPAAHQAAARFGLDVASLEVVAHAYNTTFAVDTPSGRRVAVRLNTNSKSTGPEVVAQQAWQLAITADTDVVVPEPLLATDGAWFVEVPCDGFGRPIIATAASWLEGPNVDLDLTDEVAVSLGRAMAALHHHAEGWALPAGSAMPTFDTPLFGDIDLLDRAPGLTTDQRGVVEESRERCNAAFARVYDGASLRALHADLHGGNLKWNDGVLAVFDFDDCGLGVPALDLAISAFYLRLSNPAAEDMLRSGYATVAPLPAIDPADHEALIAARQLLLMNSLVTSTTAELRAAAASYAITSVERLDVWLTTGRFAPTLPSRAGSDDAVSA